MSDRSPIGTDEALQERLQAYDAALADPELASVLDALSEAVAGGQITPAELAGMRSSELDAAYASAVRLIDLGKPIKALKILGTLIYLDSKQSRFATLAGIALQRMGQFELADRYYQVALATNADDALALLCRGEVQLHLGRRELGAELLLRGLDLAKTHPSIHRAAQRARAIAQSHGLLPA